MLWGLLAILIPIAIHLFNFRKHKLVYFSNTAVLRNIQQENAKTRKLKYFVTLCLRCLFIVALVLAFAFPYRSDKQLNTNMENNLVGIYLDNSMSMKAQSKRTTMLEDARQSARDLVRSLNPSNRYVLMTNSFELQNEYPMNQEEMLDQLERMDQDGASVALGEVIDRFTMLGKQHGFARSTLFVYSDFQQHTFDLTAAQADTTMQVVVVPMQPDNLANLYIDTIWLSSPILQIGIANEVNVKIVNQNDKEVKGLPLTMSMNGSVAASTTVDIEKNGSSQVTMQFVVEQGGEQRCSVSLNDFPITFDDTYDFVLNVKPKLSVVELGEEPSDCALLFDDDEQFDYTLMHPARFDLDALAKAQFIIVNETAQLNETLQQTLLDDAAEGSSLLVFPYVKQPVANDYLYQHLNLNLAGTDGNQCAVDYLAAQYDFFSDMILDLPQQADLPSTSQHIQLKATATATILATLQNGEPFMVETKVGKGQAYVISTALDATWSDLSSNALFVPMLVKMALKGSQFDKLSYTLGEDKVVTLNDLNLEGDHHFRLCNADRTVELMPASEIRNSKGYLYLNDDLPEAGFYDLMVNDTLNRTLAWNDSRVESVMDFADREAVRQTFSDAGFEVAAVLDVADFATNDLVEAMAHQSTLWKWFVLLALLALLGEIAVLRFWK